MHYDVRILCLVSQFLSNIYYVFIYFTFYNTLYNVIYEENIYEFYEKSEFILIRAIHLRFLSRLSSFSTYLSNRTVRPSA